MYQVINRSNEVVFTGSRKAAMAFAYAYGLSGNSGYRICRA